MTIQEWLERERQDWQHGQYVAREMQQQYFTVIEDLLQIIKALDFPIEGITIVEEDKNEKERKKYSF